MTRNRALEITMGTKWYILIGKKTTKTKVFFSPLLTSN